MEEKQMQELMESIERSVKRQEKVSKLQCALSGAAAGCLAVLALLCCILMPQVKGIAGEIEAVMANLTTVSAELEAADLESLVKDVDALVVTGEESVENTMEKLNAIDFETLNRAIENLADVIEPLARFFNVFK